MLIKKNVALIRHCQFGIFSEETMRKIIKLIKKIIYEFVEA